MKNTKLIFVAASVYISGLTMPAFAAETGEALYKTYCWQCHGMNADGMGTNIPDMAVQPRDHTDSSGMKARSDQELFTAIKDGGLAISKSVLMPPWEGVLTDDEIHELVRYLRQRCSC